MPTNKNAIIRYMYLDQMLSDRYSKYTREELLKKSLVLQYIVTQTRRSHSFQNPCPMMKNVCCRKFSTPWASLQVWRTSNG